MTGVKGMQRPTGTHKTFQLLREILESLKETPVYGITELATRCNTKASVPTFRKALRFLKDVKLVKHDSRFNEYTTAQTKTTHKTECGGKLFAFTTGRTICPKCNTTKHWGKTAPSRAICRVKLSK